jgi:hypothetical protein
MTKLEAQTVASWLCDTQRRSARYKNNPAVFAVNVERVIYLCLQDRKRR